MALFKRKTHTEFLNELNIIRHDIEIIDNYINNKTKIIISYNNWLYLMTPRSLLLGYNPSIRSALHINCFILKNLKLKNNEIKNIVNYNGVKEVIISDIYGFTYKNTYKNFIKNGISIESCINKTLYIKYKFKKIHGSKYDYSKVKYINSKTKVIINCKIHGSFSQYPNHHLKGHACPYCANYRSGWTTDKWFQQAKKSIKFDSFKLYIIYVYNDTESFYKIGKTFSTIKLRFPRSKLPYNYKIIKIIEEPLNGNYKYISELEFKLHKQHKKYKYKPILHFGGNNECFSKIVNNIL